jgi:hypothetical protein
MGRVKTNIKKVVREIILRGSIREKLRIQWGAELFRILTRMKIVIAI